MTINIVGANIYAAEKTCGIIGEVNNNVPATATNSSGTRGRDKRPDGIVTPNSFRATGKEIFIMSAKDGKPCRKCGANEWNKWGQCKQCKNAYNKQWDKDNIEKKRKYRLRWNQNNPEKHTELNREWTRANPEKNRRRVRQWQDKNPEKVTASRHRYRTQKAKAGGSYTVTEWKALCEQYDNRCLACGKKTKLTADHVIPIIAGGSSDISNIQPLCLACNSSKKDKTTDYRTKPGILRWIQRGLFD